MALPLIQGLTPSAVVYDCMDELSAFLNAPKQLVQRERALFKIADLVFAGGPSLYRAKSKEHHAVYCFPSSVDVNHFGAARERGIEHPDQQSLRTPKLGYYGVIDERIDLKLIAHLAAARPAWQIVMVGPVVKIATKSLPRAANIHYFGQRAYAELPQFLAGWDACLLPFAINDATRFISPTKTLEYMAARKPIVSTPVVDVAEAYGQVVRIAADPAAFVRACEEALSQTAEDRLRRIERMDEIEAITSWDATVEAMQSLLARVTTHTAVPRAAEPQEASPRAVPMRPRDISTLIIGAGPTGLSAAHHLDAQSVLLEQGPTVGGWCRSIVEKGFTFDHAGHIMFSKDPYVHELYEKLLGDNVHWQDREAWVYTDGVYTRYPFQSALHGLPPEVLKECLVGAIEARFGSIKDAPVPAAADTPATDKAADCCADGVADIAPRTAGGPLKSIRTGTVPPQNFEEFIHKVWGAGVAKHFAVPYNRKLWALPLSEMETSWLGGRVPLPDLEEMIEGALRPVAKPVGPNARFGYPLRGGFQALMDGFLPLLKGKLRLNAKVERVSPARHEAVLADGSSYRYKQLISTVPLPKLIAMIGSEAPAEVQAAARGLRHVSVRCVNLGIARPAITDKHWIYYAGSTVFHRIFVQGNASPHCNPEGGFGITCEITYAPSKPLPCEGEALTELCIADCIRVGMLRPEDKIVVKNQVDMPCAYVVYDHARKRNVELIQRWLEQYDIILAGRYSQWEYYNSDHAFLAGKQAAEKALTSQVAESNADLASA